MAKTIEVKEMDEQLDKLIKEAEEWVKQTAEERQRKMKEVEDLYRPKSVIVSPTLRQDLVNDQVHQRIGRLSLTEVLVFSGQARPATKREIAELTRK